MNAAKTAMSSKILGPESSFFAEMAVDAVTAVRTESGGDLGKKASTVFAESACVVPLMTQKALGRVWSTGVVFISSRSFFSSQLLSCIHTKFDSLGLYLMQRSANIIVQYFLL